MTKWHRIAFVLLCVGFLAVILLYFTHLAARVNHAEHRAETDTAMSKAALSAVNDLADQVRDLGGTPVVEPSELPTPAPGAPGPQGIRGDTGPAGATGATGPRGLRGLMGLPGPIGPAGPQGVKGDTGPAGPAGADGQNGHDGADGAPGATGPAGYPDSFTIALGNGQGNVLTCTDPDGDHAYTCQP